MQAGNSATSLEAKESQESNESNETGETSGGSRRGYLMLAGQVVLTFAMLAGVGLWLLTAHDGTQRAAKARSEPLVSAPAAALAQTAGQPAAVRPEPVFTYYLVGSEAEAATLRDAFMHGVPMPDLEPGPSELVVVTSPDEETHALQEIHFERRLEENVPSMPFRVVDLRAPAGSSAPGAGKICAGLLPLPC